MSQVAYKLENADWSQARRSPRPMLAVVPPHTGGPVAANPSVGEAIFFWCSLAASLGSLWILLG